MKKILLLLIKIFIFLFIILGAWQLLFHIIDKKWILTSPVETLPFLINIGIWKTFIITAIESIIGLSVGILVGFLWAIILHQVKFIEEVFTPFGIILQATPVIALAPIVHYIIININQSLIKDYDFVNPLINTFFAFMVCINPIVLYTLKGLNEKPEEKFNYISAKGASKLQIFFYLRLPNSIPKFLDGILIAVPLCIVGAVVSEMIVAPIGLGRIINSGNCSTSPELIFTALIILAFFSTIIFIIFQHIIILIKKKYITS